MRVDYLCTVGVYFKLDVVGFESFYSHFPYYLIVTGGLIAQGSVSLINSLEMVRQLFEEGGLQSGFWHQFALTAHSPIGLAPADYGINPIYKDITFANNDVDFTDQTGIDHTQFSYGLKKSLFNFMHGIGFELPLQDWFDFKIPKTRIASDYIVTCLEAVPNFTVQSSAKVVWLGGMPLVLEQSKTKKGMSWQNLQMTFHDKIESFQITLEKDKAEWLLDALPSLAPSGEKLRTFGQLKADFETTFEDFELFWFSKPIQKLKDFGLLVI